MKIGVLSDVHSNIVALKECVAYMEKEQCDEYFLLGDYISDTPYTRETLDYLYDFIAGHKCHVLRGNREEYMLGQRISRAGNEEDEKWIWNSASGNLLFAYEQLENRDFEFFDSLPISFVYRPDGYPAITCCHGSPARTGELLQTDGDNTKNWLERIETDYLICAHTHYPGETEYRGKHYYNSGCIGIAIGDYGFAQCMILECDGNEKNKRWHPRFLKIPYDNLKVIRDIRTSGLLDKGGWFINSNIQIFLTGEDNSARMVALAKTLSEAAGEKKGWPLLKEKYFEEAAIELGVKDYRTT